MKKERSDIRKDVLWRVAVIYVLMAIFAILIIVRVLYLQIAEGDVWKEKANSFALRNITIEPNRGDICASDGKLLASSVPFYEVRMDLLSDALHVDTFKNHVDSLAIYLSRLFKDKSSASYKSELVNARKNGNRYFLVHRGVTYRQLKEIRKFPILRYGKYKGGLIVVQENKRIKPFQNLASRTIGYLSKDETVPKVGIEGAYDRFLRGVQGVKLMQRIPGNQWKPIDDGNEVEPVDGVTLFTTIDVNYQDVAESALMDQLSQHEADHGSAILMEVKTGEIKAIANLKRTSDGRYVEAYNYAIGECTEPGSTFKLASLLVLLDDNRVKLDDSVETGNGVIKYHDHTMRDTKAHGTISVKEVFEVSSNVGVSKLVVENYKDDPRGFVDKLYSMHLNNKLGIEIKGEGRPQIKYPGDSLWSGVSLPQMSIGYEVLLTPLQILTFYNAIANDGKMIKPKFAKLLRQDGDTIKEYSSETIKSRICSKKTLKEVRVLLEGVVENGTARNIANSNYKIAGKTGTAQIAKRGRYDKKTYQASFAGYFPADNPRYSCIVTINNPTKGYYYGSSVAAPVFKEIADKVYATNIEMHKALEMCEKPVDVPASKNGNRPDLNLVLKTIGLENIKDISNVNWVKTIEQDTRIEYLGMDIGGSGIPDVKGMSLKDALFILENSGMKVTAIGRGKVKKQSIRPGTDFTLGTEIIIELG